MMNKYQTDMYFGLMQLASSTSNKAFFYKDFIKDEKTYRCFGYRIINYDDFCLPWAQECRGHMFSVDNDIATKLVSLPIEKFWNLNENLATQNIDLTDIKLIMDKKDGSLISTYIHHNKLYLKTKCRLDSHIITDCTDWVMTYAPKLYDELSDLVLFGYTVNMEWTSPKNRIVLNYKTDALTVLNIRSNKTGEYVSKNKIINDYPNVYNAWVDDCAWEEQANTIQEFVNAIPFMENIEGFVVETSLGQKIKIKTNWYLERHRLIDIIKYPQKLFCAIINGAIDDIKTLCYDNKDDLKTIGEMELLVKSKFNDMVYTIEKFHSDNIELSRKDYAIKAQSLNDGFMGLYMGQFVGRENKYREYMIKHYERFLS